MNEVIHEYAYCSGTISFSSPLVCCFEAHMHFRRLEIFKHMVCSAPETKKLRDILMAGKVQRAALRHRCKEILGKILVKKKKKLTMIS